MGTNDSELDEEFVESDRPRLATLDNVFASDRAGLNLYLDEIGRFPLLTAADEVRLARRAEANDQSAKDQLVLHNLRLVISVARKYVRRNEMTLLDLVQEGTLGLMRAVDKFDWRRGYKFSTYATPWIHQACQRATHKQARAIRIPSHVQERKVKMDKVSRELTAVLGRQATDAEIADKSGLSLDHIAETREAFAVQMKSFDETVGDGDTIFAEIFADEEPDTLADAMLDLAEESDRARLIRELVAALPAQQRKVISLHFGLDGNGERSQEAVSVVTGTSRQNVSELIKKGLKQLREDVGTVGLSVN